MISESAIELLSRMAMYPSGQAAFSPRGYARAGARAGPGADTGSMGWSELDLGFGRFLERMCLGRPERDHSPFGVRPPAAPRPVSGALGKVTMTTWNAASGDSKFSKQVRPEVFFRDQQDNDFVVLQEAGRNTFLAARRAGMEISEGPFGTAICFRPHFEPSSRLTSKTLPGDGRHRDGTAIAQTFCHRGTKKIYKVVCVHAGHNGTPHNLHLRTAEGAKQAILALKKNLGYADVTLVGGDFNEMTEVVGVGTVGEGCSRRRTHRMGANDKVGASGPIVKRAFSQQLSDYGSDHTAVKVFAET